MTWPDVFVVGAAKCGTTSMHAYLGQHPDIFVAGRKELHYYTRDLLRKNVAGPGDEYTLRTIAQSEADYRASFDGAEGRRRIADVSPSYLYWHEVAKEIDHDQPDARIIIMLRDPVEKAYSQWLHQVRAQLETLSFEEAIAAEADRAARGWSDVWYYVESSKYFRQVKHYIDVFGPERVFVVITEELATEPQTVMAPVFAFLGVTANVNLAVTNRNRSGQVRSQQLAKLIAQPSKVKQLSHVLPKPLRYRLALRLIELNTGSKPELSTSTRRSLCSEFASDVNSLRTLLNRELPWASAETK